MGKLEQNLPAVPPPVPSIVPVNPVRTVPLPAPAPVAAPVPARQPVPVPKPAPIPKCETSTFFDVVVLPDGKSTRVTEFCIDRHGFRQIRSGTANVIPRPAAQGGDIVQYFWS